MGLRVQGVGFRFKGSGFGVESLGFKVLGLRNVGVEGFGVLGGGEYLYRLKYFPVRELLFSLRSHLFGANSGPRSRAMSRRIYSLGAWTLRVNDRPC